MNMDPQPELHHPVATDRITQAGQIVELTADRQQCSAIAGRLVLAEVKAFSCRFVLNRPLAGNTARREGEIVGEGHLKAILVRECVVTLDLFDEVLDERFRVRFVPSGSEADDEDPEADDEIAYAGAVIDVGEAAVEQLALIMDPYPRKPGAELPPEACDPEEGPFEALRRLAESGKKLS